MRLVLFRFWVSLCVIGLLLCNALANFAQLGSIGDDVGATNWLRGDYESRTLFHSITGMLRAAPSRLIFSHVKSPPYEGCYLLLTGV